MSVQLASSMLGMAIETYITFPSPINRHSDQQIQDPPVIVFSGPAGDALLGSTAGVS